MTPDQMRARAVASLADEFDHTHDDTTADAERWITALMRHGWRPIPTLADRPSPSRAAPRPVAEAELAKIRAALADKAGHRPELEVGRCRCRVCVAVENAL